MTLAATVRSAVSVARPDTPDLITARIAVHPTDIGGPGDSWLRLASVTRGSAVFQTENFISAWSPVFSRGRNQLRIVLVQRGEAVVGLLPVWIERGRLVTTARIAGAPVGQYDNVLIDPTADVGRVVDAACEALRAECGVDLLLLARVREDSALRATSRRPVRLGTETAPYAALDGGGADAFMATLKSRVRRQQAKRKRQLAEIGTCEFAQASDPDEAAEWMTQAIRLKRGWLCQTGRLSQAFVDPRTVELLIAAAREGAGQTDEATSPGHSRVVVSRLTVDGRTAAIEVGFVCRDTYYFYLGTFAPEFAKFGPGNVLTEAIIRTCVETGIRRYDMLAPDSRSKREWANGSVEVADLALPLSAIGRLHALIVHQVWRPAARWMFYMLPNAVRSRIADRFLVTG